MGIERSRSAIFRWIILLVSLCAFPCLSQAGSTIYYHPTNGAPLQWEVDGTAKAEIHYTVDAGGLGRLTHAEALQLLQAAMEVWEEVANVEFIFDGTTDVDIDATNYQDYAVTDSTICNDNSTLSTIENELQLNRISLIAFDNSPDSVFINDVVDSITDTGNYYATTNITCINGTNADPNSIASVQIIFNGTAIDGEGYNINDLTVNEFFFVMVHELGHSLGLDHTEVNQNLVIAVDDQELDEETYARYIPTMATTLVVHEDMATLHPDDIAAIQALYPLEGSPTTTLRGTITNSNSSDFRGAQIELRKINDPLCEVISFISGKQCTPLYIDEGAFITFSAGSQCGKSTDPSDDTGDFFLRAIPSGNYRLSAQEVIDDYKSGVIHPWGANDPLPELFGAAEFYNTSDTASENPLDMGALTVTDGEDIDGLNIVLSSSTADGDGEENLLDLSLFAQSPFTDSLTVTASSRCQANSVDYAALIGVEELVGSDGEEEEETDSSSSSGCSLVNTL